MARYWYALSSAADHDTILRFDRKIDRDSSILDLREKGLHAEPIAATDHRVKRAIRAGFTRSWLGWNTVLLPRITEGAAGGPSPAQINAALHMAIWSLKSDQDSQRHLVKDWETYGESLAFRREECRRAAQHHEEIDRAIVVLEALKVQV